MYASLKQELEARIKSPQYLEGSVKLDFIFFLAQILALHNKPISKLEEKIYNMVS